jgi:hypothetical protein
MQQADAPLGVPGDASTDGVESPSVAAAATADRLRTLADWLDAHPGAVVHAVNFIDYRADGLAEANSFGVGSVDEMYRRAHAIEPGGWVFMETEASAEMARVIAPGLRFRFFLSRAKAAELEAEAA